MHIRIIFGSNTGNTERAANLLQEELDARGATVDVHNIATAAPEDFTGADALILGVSTWDDGVLQDDWQQFFPRLDEIDLSGKPVALFGLGDAFGFSQQFVNALRTLHDKVRERGAEIVGYTATEGYDFTSSTAVEDGHFVGLVLDQENQKELTPARVEAWAVQVQAAFAQ